MKLVKFNKVSLLSLLLVLSTLMTSCFEQKNSSLKKGTELPNLTQNGSDLPSGGDKNSLLGVVDEVESINTKTSIITLNSEDYTQYILLENSESSSLNEKVLNAKKQPVLVFFHGGEWNSSSVEDHAFINALTENEDINKAINVVRASYRSTQPEDALSSRTSPLPFDQQDVQNRYPSQVQDVDCALRWVAANATKYNFDLDKIYMGGISSGGHLALLHSLSKKDEYKNPKCPYASQDLPVVKKVIAIGAQTDLQKFVYKSDDPTIQSNGSNIFRDAFIDSSSMDKASPLNRVTLETTTNKEFLLIYSRTDNVVNYETQFLPFVNKLNETKSKVGSLVFNNANHFFTFPEDVNYSFYILKSIEALILGLPILDNAQVIKQSSELNTTYKLKITGINFDSKTKILIRSFIEPLDDSIDPSAEHTASFKDSSTLEFSISQQLKDQLLQSPKIYISVTTTNKNNKKEESNLKTISTSIFKDVSTESEINENDNVLHEEDIPYLGSASRQASSTSKSLYASDEKLISASKSLQKKALATKASSSKNTSAAVSCKDGEMLSYETGQPKCKTICEVPYYYDLSNSTKCAPINTVPDGSSDNVQDGSPKSGYTVNFWKCSKGTDKKTMRAQACRYQCNDGYVAEQKEELWKGSRKVIKSYCAKYTKVVNSTKSTNAKCPDNYVFIKADSSVGATKDFCVMKYKAKSDAPYSFMGPARDKYNASKAYSIPDGNVFLLGPDDAYNKCASLGRGYALMSNAEWAAIARTIEKVNQNWSSGKVGDGKVYLSSGYVNYHNLPGYSGMGFVSDPTDPYSDITFRKRHYLNDSEWNGGFFDRMAANKVLIEMHYFRRLLYLSDGGNAEVIWDFSNNMASASEWVDNDSSDSKFTALSFFSYPLNDSRFFDLQFASKLNWAHLTSKFGYDHTNGMGFIYMHNYYGGVSHDQYVTRGGSGLFGTNIFSLKKESANSLNSPKYSFRCVYRLP